MNYIRYIFAFLYRIMWWLILGTTIITLAIIYLTKNLKGDYYTEATLYTGVVSGYSIEGNQGKIDWGATQNAMDNLINIMKAESTLKRVSYRLFARVLMYGNPHTISHHITPESYKVTYNHLKNSPKGDEILALIVKDDENKTVENFLNYSQPNKGNYLYGLFYWFHPYFSYDILQTIKIKQEGNSDLLKISYESADPGIAYNTLDILTKEFVNEYQAIRYGETDKVIEYFRKQLEKIGKELEEHEDDLTKYNVDKRIINYLDETKEIAAINKEFELRKQTILFAYNSSQAVLKELEQQMSENMKEMLNSARLIDKLNEASNLTGKITELESFNLNPERTSDIKEEGAINLYKNQLAQTRQELSDISNNYVSQKYTKEGIARTNIVEQWLDQKLLLEKSKAELKIMEKSQENLNDKYAFYAPVGSTIKRKERIINFNEQNYLTILRSYNDALLRRKNLEMTSASLKVLNEPAFPISPQRSSRRKIVIATFLGTFLFIFTAFLLIELFDRTLRDDIRTKRLTRCNVLGAFPQIIKTFSAKTNRKNQYIAAQFLSLSILKFFNKKKEDTPYIVNILSTHSKLGKSYLSKILEALWKEKGFKVKRLNWEKDLDSDSRAFAMAKSIKELYPYNHEDILIVEHKSVNKSSIPATLLQESNLNLVLVSAKKGWKDIDDILLQQLKKQSNKAPLYLYLNHANTSVVEKYTGMLHPYTAYHNFRYKLSQLALTEQTICKKDYNTKKKDNKNKK